MRDLTQGSITKHLFQLPAFLSVSLILHTLYLLVDLHLRLPAASVPAPAQTPTTLETLAD